MKHPFEMQSEILSEYEESNLTAHQEIAKRISGGIVIVTTGSMTGSYTTTTNYFLSDGTAWTIVGRASLAWAFNVTRINL